MRVETRTLSLALVHGFFFFLFLSSSSLSLLSVCFCLFHTFSLWSLPLYFPISLCSLCPSLSLCLTRSHSLSLFSLSLSLSLSHRLSPSVFRERLVSHRHCHTFRPCGHHNQQTKHAHPHIPRVFIGSGAPVKFWETAPASFRVFHSRCSRWDRSHSALLTRPPHEMESQFERRFDFRVLYVMVFVLSSACQVQ